MTSNVARPTWRNKITPKSESPRRQTCSSCWTESCSHCVAPNAWLWDCFNEDEWCVCRWENSEFASVARNLTDFGNAKSQRAKFEKQIKFFFLSFEKKFWPQGNTCKLLHIIREDFWERENVRTNCQSENLIRNESSNSNWHSQRVEEMMMFISKQCSINRLIDSIH